MLLPAPVNLVVVAAVVAAATPAEAVVLAVTAAGEAGTVMV